MMRSPQSLLNRDVWTSDRSIFRSLTKRKLSEDCLLTHLRRRPIHAFSGRRKIKTCFYSIAPETVFNFTSVAVMPFYLMMIAFPRLKQTRWIMLSPWPTIVLSTIYLSVLMHCCTTGWIPKLISVFRCSWPTPNIVRFSEVLMEPWAIVLTWVNLLVMDLHQARTVFLDGWNRQIFVSHSIFLCFMFGPLGVLSHHLTEKLTQNRSNHQNEEDSESVAMTEKISPFLKR